MSDYAIVHNGRAFTPNGASVAPESVETHNAVIEASEIDWWTTKPERMLAYYSFPTENEHREAHHYRNRFSPRLENAVVTTWQGKVLGAIAEAHVYPHNFGSRMVAISVCGNNGANYYGRASWDNRSCINLRRIK